MIFFPYVLAFSTSLLLIASFPPFNLFLLGWIAFVPLFFAVQKLNPRQAALVFYLSGFWFFLALFHWLHIFGWYAWISGASYEALFFLLWGFATQTVLRQNKNSFLIFLFPPLIYIGVESIRSFGPLGMPWGGLAYSQWKFLPVAQLSSLVGTQGLGFVMMFANVFFYHAIRRWDWKFTLAGLLCFLIPSSYGVLRMQEKFSPKLRVAIIQTNDAQTMKWNPLNFDVVVSEMDGLVSQVVSQHPDLIFFPETDPPGYLDQNPELETLVRSWAFKTHAYLAVGTLRMDRGFPQNIVVLVEPTGLWRQTYAKVKLVPFGEYLPLFFRPLRGHWHVLDPIMDFEPGKEFTVLQFPNGRFGMMVCFESSFDWIARKLVMNGAQFLGISTNDAWFQGTSAQEQHASMAVFRAVETRRSVIQAGNTGISCIIDPLGRTLAWQDPQTRGMAAAEIPLESSLTVYSRIGRYAPWFWILLPALLCVINIFLLPHPEELEAEQVSEDS